MTTTSRRALLALFVVAGLACGSAARVAHQGDVAPASPASPAPYTPAPSATPSAAPTAAVQPLRPPTNPPVQAPAKVVTFIANRLQGPGLDVAIGANVTGSCAVNRTLAPGSAHVDPCEPGLWFDCHVGTCPAMNSWGVGAAVTWWDGGGIPHTYHVTGVSVVPIDNQPHQVAGGPVHFQVCTSLAGASARVLAAA